MGASDDRFERPVDGGSLSLDTEQLVIRDAEGGTAEFPSDSTGELKAAVDEALEGQEKQSGSWFRPGDVKKLTDGRE